MTSMTPTALAAKHAPSTDSLAELGALLGHGGQKPTLNQRDMAQALSQALLAQWRQDPGFSPDVARLCDGMIDALWPTTPEAAPDAMAQVQAQIAALADPAQQKQASNVLAQLGHMHQLAAMLVRDHTLQQAVKGNGHREPSTAEAFLAGKLGRKRGKVYGSAASAVAALNKPAVELTFTGHPTNTNSLESMQAQRALGLAIDAWRSHPDATDRVAQALANYAHTPMLTYRPDGQPGFSVRDEVQHMLHFMHCTYADMPAVYDGYDRALHARFQNDYDPTSLRLNVKFHSWGSSGDKDGNAKVNGDTTLYALSAHYEQGLAHLLADLPHTHALKPWRMLLENAQREATQVRQRIDTAMDAGAMLDAAEFDQLSAGLKKAVSALDAPRFRTDLLGEYQQADGSVQGAFLNCLRRFDTFGFGFGQIEYRETAEEYARIVEAMVPGYAGMDEAGRVATLNTLLQQPDAGRTLSRALHEAGASGHGKAYSTEDVAPIAYQTRKRLELARDFPAMFHNNVLAECNATSNMMEALTLQHAVTDAQGTRATLGIVPLFEDQQPFESAPDILVGALDQQSYRDHLMVTAKAHGSEPTQQMQSAHSDNVRRNGLLGGRELIKTNIERVRGIFREYNAEAQAKGEPTIRLQQYYGGSQSDPYRGGVRSISATVNEFGLHDFTKMTFQGGDLLNYLNQPNSTFRLLMRNLTHSAAKLENPERPLTQSAKETDRSVARALASTRPGYIALFNDPAWDDFLSQIGFSDEAKYGNASSRVGARKAVARPTQSRTITFSEGQQHAGITPTWVGALALPEALATHVKKARTPADLRRLYQESPLFKDVMDRMLFGLVRSDMPYLRARSGDHPLMDRFEQEYAVAFKLCLEAYTGKPIETFTQGKPLTPGEQHDLLINLVYPHVKDTFDDQDRYTALVRSAKQHWLASEAEEESTKGMLLHNGMDTVLHGRIPMIDDPTYATLHCRAQGIQRPFGPTQLHGAPQR
ncbi:MAG: hypothetical protein DI582_07985 [Azospirillum brasilense]|nr:MAG: hypothetical protein DI582_07985 [Azospirillum brasilense]